MPRETCPRCQGDPQPTTDDSLWEWRQHTLRALLCERYGHVHDEIVITDHGLRARTGRYQAR